MSSIAATTASQSPELVLFVELTEGEAGGVAEYLPDCWMLSACRRRQTPASARRPGRRSRVRPARRAGAGRRRRTASYRRTYVTRLGRRFVAVGARRTAGEVDDEVAVDVHRQLCAVVQSDLELSVELSPELFDGVFAELMAHLDFGSVESSTSRSARSRNRAADGY